MGFNKTDSNIFTFSFGIEETHSLFKLPEMIKKSGYYPTNVEIVIGENINVHIVNNAFPHIFSLLTIIGTIYELSDFRIVFPREDDNKIRINLNGDFPEYENYWDIPDFEDSEEYLYKEVWENINDKSIIGNTMKTYLNTELFLITPQCPIAVLSNSDLRLSLPFRDILANELSAFILEPQGKKPYVEQHEFDWNDVPSNELWRDAYGDAPDAEIGHW